MGYCTSLSRRDVKDQSVRPALCTYLRAELDCLPRHSEWVFPARRTYFKELRRLPEFNHNPHSLRRLYRTMCVEAGVEFTMAKLLLNHSMAGDIRFRYVSRASSWARCGRRRRRWRQSR